MNPRRSLLILVLAGCAGPEPEASLGLTLHLPAGPALDPKGAGASLPIQAVISGASPDSSCDLAWTVEDPLGRARAWTSVADGDLADTAWDGLLDDALPADPGPVRIVAVATCPGGDVSASADAWVARLGIAVVDVRAHPDDGEEIALAYHKSSLWADAVVPLDGLPEYRSAPDDAASDLDAIDGTPLGVVEPWTQPDVPPWGDGDPGDVARSLPAALVAGDRVRLDVTVGATAVSARTGATVPALGSDARTSEAPVLRLVADGWTPADGEGLVTPGGSVTFDAPEATATLGREDVLVTLRFQAMDDTGWHDVPGGTLGMMHRVYRLLDVPPLQDGRDRDCAGPWPWVGALEDTLGAVQGLDADPASVMDALRDHLNLDPYLVYNPSDRAYTSYSGQYIYWDWIWADLSGWLDRRDGIELYCHSLSCLLSVLAAEWGVPAEQQVLGVGFTTNFVRAAGTETWQQWGFNSHSVASPDGGATIWDASVDMDCDGAPGGAPHTACAPKGLPLADYLALLTPDAISIVNAGACYVQ